MSIHIEALFSPDIAELIVSKKTKQPHCIFRVKFDRQELHQLSQACAQAVRVLDSIEKIIKETDVTEEEEEAFRKIEEDLTPDGRYSNG